MDYGPSLNARWKSAIMGRISPTRGSPSGSTRGRGNRRGRAWVVYDHDTMRLAAAWTGQGFIDWNGINFNGRHQVHPRIIGPIQFSNAISRLGESRDESVVDLRQRGRDARPYGPLPRRWIHYKGMYRNGEQVILAYAVGNVEIPNCPVSKPILPTPIARSSRAPWKSAPRPTI